MDDKLVLSAGYALISPEKEPQSKIIMANQEESYVRGLVVAVGGSFIQDGVEFKPPCGVGDSVLYSFGGYGEIYYKENKVRVIRFSSVVGVFKKGKNAAD